MEIAMEQNNTGFDRPEFASYGNTQDQKPSPWYSPGQNKWDSKKRLHYTVMDGNDTHTQRQAGCCYDAALCSNITALESMKGTSRLLLGEDVQ
jgi:hypothetical protein